MPDYRYDAGRQTVGTLLSRTSPAILVPEWQRSYAWGNDQIDSFWSDLTAFGDKYSDDNIAGQEYFLGSLVLVTSGSTHLLLDGQQRLATATILLSALRDSRRDISGPAAVRIQSKYIADFDDSANASQYTLTLNEYDRDFFRAEVQDDSPDRPRPRAVLRSHARIRKARNYFMGKMAEKRAELGSTDFFQWNVRIAKVLTDHMSLVVVTSLDEDNAASVFETLNDRGIGLSTPDLLRNFLLRKGGNATARERMVDAWQKVLTIEEENLKTDQFLRHYWVSVYGDVKARALYRQMKATLESETDFDPVAFTDSLAEAAQVYRELAKASVIDPALKDQLESIATLNATVLYPALLAAWSATDGDQTAVAHLAKELVVLFVRYNVIGGRESTTLESAVYGLAAQLRRDGNILAALAAIRPLAPTLLEFRARFCRVSVPTQKTARYILREIEHELRATPELRVAQPSRVHLEHIYPQKPAEGRRWANHSAVLNRLGNLTLLSAPLNTSIQNSDFSVKKEKAYVKSDLLITQALDGYASWDMEAIETRQIDLAATAINVWRFTGEPLPAASLERQTAEGLVPDETDLTPEELPEVPA